MIITACGSDDDGSTSDVRHEQRVGSRRGDSPGGHRSRRRLNPPDDGYGGELPTSEAPAQEGEALQLADTSLGPVLVKRGGFTVYAFTPDAQGESTCYDECATTWPAVTAVDGVGEGLDASLLGSTERTDGEQQATYNGWPLYFFSGDAAAGDVNGQGVGGVWYVIDGTGTVQES